MSWCHFSGNAAFSTSSFWVWSNDATWWCKSTYNNYILPVDIITIHIFFSKIKVWIWMNSFALFKCNMEQCAQAFGAPKFLCEFFHWSCFQQTPPYRFLPELAKSPLTLSWWEKTYQSSSSSCCLASCLYPFAYNSRVFWKLLLLCIQTALNFIFCLFSDSM